MYQLAKLMALFWTIAEGLILLYLRWGYLRLRGDRSDPKSLHVLCAGIFCVLLFWMLAGDTIAQWSMSDVRHITLYRWGSWNFFCTLWVALEGVIMLYVIRIYRLLRPESGCEGRTSTKWILWPLLLLFVLSQAALLETALNREMEAMEIYNVSVFYVRLCGFFWIGFEWVVAIYGIRTYGLLKREVRTS